MFPTGHFKSSGLSRVFSGRLWGRARASLRPAYDYSRWMGAGGGAKLKRRTPSELTKITNCNCPLINRGNSFNCDTYCSFCPMPARSANALDKSYGITFGSRRKRTKFFWRASDWSLVGALHPVPPARTREDSARWNEMKWFMSWTGWRIRLWMNALSLSRKQVCVIESLSGAGCRRKGSERDGSCSKYCAAWIRREYFQRASVFVWLQWITVQCHSSISFDGWHKNI